MQEWWTAAELAAARLPHMPRSIRGLLDVAERQNWREQRGRARRRRGRGGGWEYHISLLPIAAQDALREAHAEEDDTRLPGESSDPLIRKYHAPAWARFHAAPKELQERAQARLNILEEIEARVHAGYGKDDAVIAVGAKRGVSKSTIWNWYKIVLAYEYDQRLPYLLPRTKRAPRLKYRAEVDQAAWEAFLADYLRPEQPSLTSCYRRVEQLAKRHGWVWPREQAVRRKLERDVPKPNQILARKGLQGLKAAYPPQTRDKHMLHALECVNADGHRWDVFVKWPDGTIARPVMVAFQDVYSSRILSWRICQSESRIPVLLALGDLIETYGIPDHCVLDNGRGFASKWLTGGIPNRFRFKVKADDPVGVLPMLGIKVHWTIPYSGRSKPIERAFRDLADTVAKDPRLAGAYTGNRPDAKPENYGKTAIPLEDFEAIVAEGIVEHNTRIGRRSEISGGRSFAEVFDESYAKAPIRKSIEEQRLLWLMGVEKLRAEKDSGMLRFLNNSYWAEFMIDHAGKHVAARFDPDNLQDGLYVYAMNGSLIGHAPCMEKTGFLDAEGAQRHQRAQRQFFKAEREKLKALKKMQLIDLQNALNGLGQTEEGAPPSPKVVRPQFGGAAAAVQAKVDQDLAEAERLAAASEEHWANYQAGIELIFEQEE